MKFQWYIVGTDDLTVQGANNVEDLQRFMDDDRYILLSGQHGVFFNGDPNIENSVEAIKIQEEDKG